MKSLIYLHDTFLTVFLPEVKNVPDQFFDQFERDSNLWDN